MKARGPSDDASSGRSSATSARSRASRRARLGVAASARDAVDPVRKDGAGPSVGYVAKLEASDIESVRRGPWAVVGRTEREQGWKLHLSTIPIEALSLLDTVLPVLHRCGVSFKVARDESILRQLNEGTFGPTQIGKFLTIYPRTNREARALALELEEVTRGFAGPVIPTDLRLGDVVYARYGPFSPPMLRDRLGNVSSALRLPDGELVPHVYSVPFEPPERRVNPFRDLAPRRADAGLDQGGSRLFGPGYVILDVLRPHPRGSVFLALDARFGGKRASLCVIKEGRSHCFSDGAGRDMRTRLKRQASILAALSGKLPVPAPGPYFEVAENGYLPLEYVLGADLGFDVSGAFGSLSRRRQGRVVSRLIELSRIIARLHAEGYLHRDVKPSNFRVRPDDHLSMIDVELAHSLAASEPPFGSGTPGFMSPQQQTGEAPSAADDVFGLGATALYLLTGIHPLRLVFSRRDVRPSELRELAHGAPAGLVECVARCLSVAPELRPDVRSLEAALCEAAADVDGTHKATRSRAPSRARSVRLRAEVRGILPRATHGLLEEVCLDDQLGLWLSQKPEQIGAKALVASEYGLYRSANRGVAGVVYCLSRLARYGFVPRRARKRIADAVDWLLAHAATSDDQLPGLHFGEAGVAVAIAEAVRSGLIDRGPWLDEYLAEALHGPLDWHDLTHGAAGQGIAAMCCADVLDEPRLFSAAHRCASFLVATQDRDGGWTTPPGAAGLSGARLTGFAHGAAGIVYFLCEYSVRAESATAKRAALRGAGWLRAQARTPRSGGFLEWPTREGEDDVWRWWCHGAPGIALVWLKLFEHYRDPDDEATAVRSLRSHPPEVRYSNLSSCHGLCGLGEIYLEAQRVLAGPEWSLRAERVANVLLQLGRPTGDGVTWLVEDGLVPTGDLMVGCAGIAHFLLRVGSDDRLTFPLLP